jgi:hypothetical protein
MEERDKQLRYLWYDIFANFISEPRNWIWKNIETEITLEFRRRQIPTTQTNRKYAFRKTNNNSKSFETDTRKNC